MIFVLSISVFFSFVGCSREKEPSTETPGVTPTEIAIGCSAALGGQASFLGTQYVHGSMALLNDVNAHGGVNGRKIRLIAYDDQYDPSRTVANTQKLIGEDRVFALFDFVGTPTSMKVVDIVNEARIPAIGFFTGAEGLRTPFRPYIFNVRDSYYSETEAAAAYFVDKLGVEKIAVMYQEDAFGLAVLSGIQLALQRRNMETVATDTYVRGTMDVEDGLKTIKASGAEAVVLVGTYAPLAKFIKLAHQSGFTPSFHTVSFVGSDAFGKELMSDPKIESARLDSIVVTQVVPSPFEERLAAVKKYRQLARMYYPHDAPNYVALEGFVNGIVLVKALDAAGRNVSREKFIAALESLRQLDVGLDMGVTYGVLDHQGLGGVYYSKLMEDGTFRLFSP